MKTMSAMNQAGFVKIFATNQFHAFNNITILSSKIILSFAIAHKFRALFLIINFSLFLYPPSFSSLVTL